MAGAYGSESNLEGGDDHQLVLSQQFGHICRFDRDFICDEVCRRIGLIVGPTTRESILRFRISTILAALVFASGIGVTGYAVANPSVAVYAASSNALVETRKEPSRMPSENPARTKNKYFHLIKLQSYRRDKCRH
ncbi:hypothetical protein [Aminobacter carboxidus]|uniref:Transmembrane protein n=1 Tax=Aminobacter carboxidus TaxID=376165 RepID=A0ABR9GLX7_9HYPH|nr:hypothetical protein [Aminobacter carboxidus]MBE1204680.1 hypothetical protein [Aminobacter carboxidus]